MTTFVVTDVDAVHQLVATRQATTSLDYYVQLHLKSGDNTGTVYFDDVAVS